MSDLTFTSEEGFWVLCDPDDAVEGGVSFRTELVKFLSSKLPKYNQSHIKKNLWSLNFEKFIVTMKFE